MDIPVHSSGGTRVECAAECAGTGPGGRRPEELGGRDVEGEEWAQASGESAEELPPASQAGSEAPCVCCTGQATGMAQYRDTAQRLSQRPQTHL